MTRVRAFRTFLALLLAATLVSYPSHAQNDSRMRERWLFIFKDVTNAQQVDKMIALFPRAKADGYNGIALSYNVAPEKAAEVRQAAKANGLKIVAMVMGGAHDRNYEEGLPVKDALYLTHDFIATFQPDNPTHVANGDFENVNGNHFSGWSWQDNEGVTTFADHDVVHSGKTSLRMEGFTKNDGNHDRVSQTIKLQPYRQYKISFWIKTQGLAPAEPEIKVLTADGSAAISYQTFQVDATQDWKHYDLSFNSLENTSAILYAGTWNGKDGKMWWDDLSVDEIGLVNVMRRAGCPVTVKGEDGTVFEEGRDYRKIVDPELHPWIAFHDQPIIHLLAGTRIKDGQRLRVSYYHPVLVYDRITSCISEPEIFKEWRDEVQAANERLQPAAFMMQHDEMRVMNQCASCRAMNMTAGQLLAWNLKKSAQIIRDLRPDAQIWVWSDMFDPTHNAHDHYYLVRGTLAGSWEGLRGQNIGVVNWNGGAGAKSSKFFADLGVKQVLSGYYDGDSDGSAIAKWEADTAAMPGVVGAMYTTWTDNYDPMDVWAKKAWGSR
jgi:hypothetical protein